MMVKVTLKDGRELYLDGILKSNLDIIKAFPKKDRDALIIFDGKEREGKSTMAHQILSYLTDGEFNLGRTVFTARDFIDTIRSVDSGAVLFDEAHGYLNSRQSLSKFNRTIIQVLAEMGSKNLFVGMCLPSFFELDKYAAIHRSICLIHIYERGKFTFYNYDKKKSLYIKGKKFYNYSIPANFYGRFTKLFPFDYKEYNDKKVQALRFSETDRGMESKKKLQRDSLIKLKHEEGWTCKKIADYITENSKIELGESEVNKITLSQR